MAKTNCFISYHHKREQKEKDELSKLIRNCYGEYFDLKDMSVEIGDIDIDLPDRTISKIIREQHLKGTHVTIVILGKHTKCRKHIDWEIGASLKRYGSLNRRKVNGLIVLLTDDFIEKEKTKHFFGSNNYSSLVNEKNSGQRIYENIKNNYAIVESLSNVLSNPSKLKTLVEKSQYNSKKIKPDNEFQLKINNAEKCPKKSKNYIERCLEYFHCSLKDQKSQKSNFEQIKFEVNSLIENKMNNNSNEKIFDSLKYNLFLSSGF